MSHSLPRPRLFALRALLLTLVVALVGAIGVGTAPSAQAATVSCTISSTRTVRYGDSGSCVRLLQQRLGGLAADGAFGPKTLARVKTFQRSHGLSPDGVVGPLTWRALRGSAVTADSGGAPSCSVSYRGRTLRNMCGTAVAYVTFSHSGTRRVMAIGADGRVYNIVYYPSTGYLSTWQSLGGVARGGVYLYTNGGPDNFRVRTTGTDGRWYCQHYTGRWSGWQRCPRA
ncbi:hypothetical protein GCM10009841_09560 [Microlunatus panaciterrae]|uniref:Peptidoglycan hydrolase-like protein with peptidoglycan-binding domain n=1 Tax=Microlunatus panaciterrae TaxID=400768 RepID=A0ABS2RLG1_9ACTN|nr:peptidoglycan-binding domain-containing protein [Microlunatus panaciterrae]MBM7799503.1 peptidoglycan hydrolase-like protein with peptidoglycan-binding domain [Microlunatus panaciterrae]